MLKDIFNAGGKTIKYIFIAGFVGALLLVASMRGCSMETNKYDAKNIETTTKASIELQKMQNAKEETTIRQNTIEKSAEAASKTEMRISDNETSVELKKTLDVTAIEQKKLEMQDKSILDVNKAEQMKMELEMKKLELIEAQKLENELKMAEMRIELEKVKLEKEKAAANAKAQDAARKKAQAKAQAEKAKQNEVDIYKAILNN